MPGIDPELSWTPARSTALRSDATYAEPSQSPSPIVQDKCSLQQEHGEEVLGLFSYAMIMEAQPALHVVP